MERKLVSSFVSNVGGMLKEIFVEFHKAQWRGSQMEGVEVGRSGGRWGDGWGRMRREAGALPIIFSSEEGGALVQAWREGVEAEFAEISTHSVPGGMLSCWPLQSSLPPRCWAQLLRAAPAGRVKGQEGGQSEERAGDTGLCKMLLFFLAFNRWSR